MQKQLLFLIFFECIVASSAFARPEYAVKYGYNQCTACHVSSFGGGPRNLNGKLFGAHGIEGSALPPQDMFSLDLRVLASYPDKPAIRQSGPALMEAVPWANIPLTKNSSNQVNSRVVAGYGIGGLATGARDLYAQFDLLPAEDRAALKHFMIGRFNSPFGLLTDEHRTFARQATVTTVNDFEFGGAISGDPTASFHYDLAATNGFQSGGTQSTGLPWALIFNIRHSPVGAPFFLGWSAMLHRKLDLPYKPWAHSLWSAFAFDRITGGSFPLTIMGEAVIARGWNGANNSYISRFIPTTDTAWKAAVADTQSLSIYAMAIYELSSRFAIVYKFDEFAPSRNYTADAFVRHSGGFRWFVNSNMQILARREISKAKRPGVSTDDSQNSRSGYLAVMQIAL